MSNVDLLMGLDADKLAAVPTKELKVQRLSQLAKADFIVKVKAIPAKRFTEFVGGIRAKDGSVDASKAYEANVKIALAGMVDPPMKDKDLMEKFGCSTPMQLIEKIFQGSEIGAIADTITELSGFGGNVVEEVKKLIYSDEDMTNMYVLFREMHWKPSDYYFMTEGEKIVVRAMLLKFSEETKKEQEKLEKMRRATK